MSYDPPPRIIDAFDRIIGAIDGLPDVTKARPTTVTMVQTYKMDDGFHLFLQMVDAEGRARIAIPPKVAAAIYRQRDSLVKQSRRLDQERTRYDEDDRERCECRDHPEQLWGMGAIDNDGRCLNSTRHPSRTCVDCRGVDRGIDAHLTACFCGGPWMDQEPERMPETALGREHRQGDPGCVIGAPPDPRAAWPVDFEEGEA